MPTFKLQRNGRWYETDAPSREAAEAKLDSHLNPQKSPEVPEEKSLSGFGDNVVDSGFQYGKDMWEAVTNPIDTGAALAQLGIGTVQKLIPGQSDRFNYEHVADAVGEYYGDRYGGWDDIVDTAYNDPVGLLSDISLGGGSIAKLGAKAAKISKKTAGAAPNLQKVGSALDYLDPANVGAGLAGRAGGMMVGKGPAIKTTRENVKFSTAKNSPENKTGAADRMAETMLRYKLDPTDPKSIDKLMDVIRVYEEQASGAVKQFDQQGGTIDAMPALQALEDLKKTYEGSANPDAPKKVEAIENYRAKAAENLENPSVSIQGSGRLTGQQALDARRAVDADIDWKATKPKQTATNEARKAYAGALRAELAKRVNGLAGTNAEFGKVLEVQDPLRRASQRNANNSGLLRTLTTGNIGLITAAATGGAMPLIVGMINSKLLSPQTQQNLAQMLFDRQSGAKKISDRTVAVEVLRAIQEIEQTGVADEQ